MPDDTKKKQKGKHEAKEHRRKRQARQQACPVERKQDKELETPKETSPEQPAYQPPGPEFYKGLKRETDEILKISEEENSKYKNKEIESNWAKYEMPIESYEKMDEQEQLGADYETLIQAPLSVGTHFQFKHEKSWDVTSGPSPYQKYFDIDMGNLIVALSTIPFYERNSIDQSIFTDSDFQSMDQRATKYKQKYYGDSKYNTAELEAQNSIRTKLSNINKHSESAKAVNSDIHTEKCDGINDVQLFKLNDIKLEENDTLPIDNKHQNLVIDVTDNSVVAEKVEKINMNNAEEIDEMKHLHHINIVNKFEPSTIECCDPKINIKNDPVITNDKTSTDNKLLQSPKVKVGVSVPVLISEESAEETHSRKDHKKPLIESPEDLEKWLDDFLDN